MTDIKIPSSPLESGAIDAARDASEAMTGATEAGGAEAVSGAVTDSVDRIAAEVAAGKIGQAEAVERILEDVMGSPALAGAPEAMRQELGEALRLLLDEDPHLRSLKAAISPGESE